MSDHIDHPQPASIGAAEIVELDLPLNVRHASTVRAVAATLAADAGSSVDDIDDLRLGVNEAVSVLTDVDHAGDARLHLRFEVTDGTVTLIARRHGVDRPVTADDLDVLATRILRAVVDEFRVDETGAFVVTKRVIDHAAD